MGVRLIRPHYSTKSYHILPLMRSNPISKLRQTAELSEELLNALYSPLVYRSDARNDYAERVRQALAANLQLSDLLQAYRRQLQISFPYATKSDPKSTVYLGLFLGAVRAAAQIDWLIMNYGESSLPRPAIVIENNLTALLEDLHTGGRLADALYTDLRALVTTDGRQNSFASVQPTENMIDWMGRVSTTSYDVYLKAEADEERASLRGSDSLQHALDQVAEVMLSARFGRLGN